MKNINQLIEEGTIQAINTVFETEDYDLFQNCPFNRDVFPDHLQKIMFNIQSKDLGEGAPIVVDKNYVIIDGQTRFEARKLLSKPIQFIQVEWLNLEEDIALLNISQKPWSHLDFLNSYSTLHLVKSKHEYENYTLLKDFMKKYALPIGVAIRVFQLRKNTALANRQFTTGNLTCPDIEKSEELIQFMQEAFAIINVTIKHYQQALWFIFENEDIDNALFLDCLRNRRNTFQPGLKSTKEYIRWFDDSIINGQTYSSFRKLNKTWKGTKPVNFITNLYEKNLKADRLRQLEEVNKGNYDQEQAKLKAKARRFFQEKENRKNN
tara:strand:- start:205 stop:1170 length:966 start_codon:yes stop_codon:yes gene_type:complete